MRLRNARNSKSAEALAMQQGLQNLGWIDGQNVTIVYRWAGGDPARKFGLINEKVDAASHDVELDLIAGLNQAN